MPLSDAQRRFLERLKEAAGVAEARGVPAAVMVAQGIIESDWGRSELTRKGNAAFGIKANSRWAGAVYSGTTYEWEGGKSVKYHGTNRIYASRGEALAAGAHTATLFRAYRSLTESVLDHTEFFHDNRRYHGCVAAYALDRDPFEFAACIHRAGYATAQDYTQTLHKAMRAHASEMLQPQATIPGAPPAPLPTPGTVVVIDGRTLSPEDVREVDGKAFVHVRRAFEAAGWTVVWDAVTRKVEVRPPR